MQENESDVFEEGLNDHERWQNRLSAALKIAALVAITASVVVYMVHREMSLARGTRSRTRQTVGSELSPSGEKQVADPAAGRSGERPQVVNVVRQVTNVVERRVDVTVERKRTNYVDRVVDVTNFIDKVVDVTNYVDKVVDVTNYVDKVVDVVVLRTNEIERQVSLPATPESDGELVRETDEPKRQIEQALAELAKEANVGSDEPNVQVTNVVERKVDVEVVRVVTNWVDRPVTVDVDRFFTNVVERPVEITVERPVTNVVERKVDVVVERPVTNFIERIVDVPVDRVVTNLVRRPVDVYVDVPVTNVIERIVEVVTTNEVSRSVVVYVDRPVTNYVERKSQVQVARPAQAARPAQVSRSAQTAVQAPKVRRPVRLTTPYRVKSGDTVGALARRYGFRIPDFRVYNPKVDVNRISIGQILNLPGDVD